MIASVTSSNSKETVVSTEANTTVLLLSSEFSAVGWKRTMNETIYVTKHSAQLKAILCNSYIVETLVTTGSLQFRRSALRKPSQTFFSETWLGWVWSGRGFRAHELGVASYLLGPCAAVPGGALRLVRFGELLTADGARLCGARSETQYSGSALPSVKSSASHLTIPICTSGSLASTGNPNTSSSRRTSPTAVPSTLSTTG